jgi:hypothetical protein
VLRTDLSHTADIEYDLLEGDGLLWLACDGSTIEAAAATLLVNTDRHLVCLITALGGANMDRWFPLLEQIEDWAKAEGAALVRVIGRPGWVRMLKNYRFQMSFSKGAYMGGTSTSKQTQTSSLAPYDPAATGLNGILGQLSGMAPARERSTGRNRARSIKSFPTPTERRTIARRSKPERRGF